MIIPARSPAHAQFSISRFYEASIDEVWSLWTTKDGVESWWGPEGFDVSVTSLDLRPGGTMIYMMTARAPEQIAFMSKARMPLTTEARLSYTEVRAPKRLAYTTLADFIPGVEPYEIATSVELQPVLEGVKLILTFAAMHDLVWSERARAGHESQLRKLDGLLANEDRGARS